RRNSRRRSLQPARPSATRSPISIEGRPRFFENDFQTRRPQAHANSLEVLAPSRFARDTSRTIPSRSCLEFQSVSAARAFLWIAMIGFSSSPGATGQGIHHPATSSMDRPGPAVLEDPGIRASRFLEGIAQKWHLLIIATIVDTPRQIDNR